MERREKLKDRTWGNCRSQKRLTIAGRHDPPTRSGMAQEKHQEKLEEGPGDYGRSGRDYGRARKAEWELRTYSAESRYIGGRKGEPQTASEGGAHDSEQIWEAEEYSTGPSRRPYMRSSA
jgi:hypothetical protein